MSGHVRCAFFKVYFLIKFVTGIELSGNLPKSSVMYSIWNSYEIGTIQLLIDDIRDFKRKK